MGRMWVRDVGGVELDDFLLGLFRHAEAVFWVHVAKQEFGDLVCSRVSNVRSVQIPKDESKANSLAVSRQ